MKPGAISVQSLSRAKDILQNNPSVDLHSHLGLWESKGMDHPMEALRYLGDDKLEQTIRQMIAGSLKCATVPLTGDTPIIDIPKPGHKTRDYVGDEAWEEYLREKAILDEFFKTMPIEPAVTAGDIERISAKGKLAVFLSTEGGHMVEQDLGRLERLHQDGVRHFQPIHYVRTALGDSQTEPSFHGGLSDLGKECLREAARLGMVIDLAHASFETAMQTVELIAKPVVFSHTMLKYDSAAYGSYLENRPRWISPDYAMLIARTGGVIGTWVVGEPLGVDDPDAFVEAVLKLADTVGIDHVGWGTDYIHASRPHWFKSFESFPALCAKLLDAGFSQEDLTKFIGGNALRVRREVSAAD